MVMVKAIVRPEKVQDVMSALFYAGFTALTRIDVCGRGRQKGMRVGEVTYDELPKQMLLIVVPEEDRPFVIGCILKAARSGDKGAPGDGKIFVSPVEQVYTISSGECETEETLLPEAAER